jgi:hypothetical protein
MEALPIYLPVGLGHKGVVRLEKPFLVFELLERSWRSFGKKQVREVRLPLDEIVDARFKPGILDAHLDLHIRSINAMKEIPYRTPGVIELRFAREHRDAARQLSTSLSLVLSERQLDDLDRGRMPS